MITLNDGTIVTQAAFNRLKVDVNWRVANLLEKIQTHLDLNKCEWKDLLNQEFMETDQDD